MAYDELKKSLPNAVDAERVILAAILLDNDLLRQTSLATTDFYSLFHAAVWSAMLELGEENAPISPVTIGEIFRRENRLESYGGIAAIANLTYGMPLLSSLSKYVRLVKDQAARRRGLRWLGKLQTDFLDESVSLKELATNLAAAESDLRSGFAEQTDSFKLLREVFESEVLPTLEAYHRNEASEFLIPTGFKEIDDVLGGGLYLSDMLAVVAPPKSAKSAFALQLALSIAQAGETVALLSLEMSNLQNGLRFIAQQSYKNAMRPGGSLDDAVEAHFLRPGIYQSTFEKARETAMQLFGANLYLCQKPLAWSEVKAEARRLVKEKNLRVLIVDYWQLVFNDNRANTRAESLSEIAKGLKQLGQELNICVITLGQFNQEGLKLRASGKELSTLYLEGSGELVKSANIVLTLDIKPADLQNTAAPRTGTMTFRPLRSASDAQLECLFFGQFLTVEITGKVGD